MDVSGDGGTGTPNGITREISDPLRSPRADEVVVQEQHGFARRRRAFEWPARDADDYFAALETRQDLTRRDRALERVELVTAFDESGVADGTTSAPSATTSTSASNVPASVTTRFADGSIARTIDCTNRTPGLTMSLVADADRVGRGATKEHVEFREAEHKRVGLVDNTQSTSAPAVSASTDVSSSPPNPAPNTTTRNAMTNA